MEGAATDMQDAVLGCQSSAGADQYILGIPYKDVYLQFRMGQLLGSGTSGMVWCCEDRQSGQRYACKSIPKSTLQSFADVSRLRNEVVTMLVIRDHPAVLDLRFVYEDSQAVHLIMDYCEGGDLYDRIMHLRCYSERDAARVCRILASVLQHCHDHALVHRDLKPENILLTSTQSHVSLRVADFGHATFHQPGTVFKDAVGSGYYIAPEVLGQSYGPEADIWSAGVILYVLLCGRAPFQVSSDDSLSSKIRAGKYDLEGGPWAGAISGDAKDLVRRMLCVDPKQRITCQEIKRHPWILTHCSHPQQSIIRAAPPGNMRITFQSPPGNMTSTVQSPPSSISTTGQAQGGNFGSTNQVPGGTRELLQESLGQKTANSTSIIQPLRSIQVEPSKPCFHGTSPGVAANEGAPAVHLRNPQWHMSMKQYIATWQAHGELARLQTGESRGKIVHCQAGADHVPFPEEDEISSIKSGESWMLESLSSHERPMKRVAAARSAEPPPAWTWSTPTSQMPCPEPKSPHYSSGQQESSWP